MRNVLLATAVLVTSLGLFGCGQQTGSVIDSSKVPAPPPKAPTLEQVKTEMPFSIVMPKQLPHDMHFWYPLIGENPNSGKPHDVTLVFTSPDQKYTISVVEEANINGQGHFYEGPTSKVEKLEIDGHPAEVVTSSKDAIILWTNGKVNFLLTSVPNTDIGTEQGMIDLTKDFE